MNRWPLKPQVTREGDRIGVFIVGAYQFMPVDTADRLARDLQRAVAIARRDFKRREKIKLKTDLPRRDP